MRRFAGSLLWLSLLLPSARAAVLYVNDEAPGPAHDGTSWGTAFLTVHEAVAAASPTTADEVWVARGVYPERLTVDRAVTLLGGFAGDETSRDARDPDRNITVLDGGGAGSVVVWLAPDGGISGFTIRNGKADPYGGGGVYCVYGTLDLSHNVITGNSAFFGGGVYALGGSVAVTGNTISGNIAAYQGGGVYAVTGSLGMRNLAILSNTITGNRAKAAGGGIYLGGSSAGVESNTISYNLADAGAGLCADGGASPYVSGNDFEHNGYGPEQAWIGSGVNGGAISVVDGSPVITGNAFTANVGAGGAGAVSCLRCAVTVAGNVFTGNYGYQGGALSLPDCTGEVRLNRFVSNHAIDTGGAIMLNENGGFQPSVSPAIRDNVMIGNSARSGSGILGFAGPAPISNNTIVSGRDEGAGAVTLNGEPVTFVNNIVAFNSFGLATWLGDTSTEAIRNNCVYGNTYADYRYLDNLTGKNGNISKHPLLANLAFGDIHLSAGSPCIDAGDDSVVVQGETDIDYQPRIYGAHVDIGADEVGRYNYSFPPLSLRVSPSGSDQNDGRTWATAMKTIGHALDRIAASLPDRPGAGEVWVAAGTYNERITMSPFVYLYGGFKGTETGRDQRDWNANPTILDGGQGGTVVKFLPGASLCAVDGFTIRNGKALQGGGVYCLGAYPLLYHDTFTGNAAGDGGGVFAQEGFVDVRYARFTGNTATGVSDGTALPVAGTGGGMHLESAACALISSIFTENAALKGGGLSFVYGGNPMVAFNTFVNNAAANGGGAMYGAGYWCFPYITSNIMAFNTSGFFNEDFPNACNAWLRDNTYFANRDYGQKGYSSPDSYGDNEADPKFVDRAAGDFHLQPGSPCIDTGDDSVILVDWLDYDGRPRALGQHADRGAYESPGPVGFRWWVLRPALRIAAGLAPAGSADMSLDVVKAPPSNGVIDIVDAVSLARKISGLDPNP